LPPLLRDADRLTVTVQADVGGEAGDQGLTGLGIEHLVLEAD